METENNENKIDRHKALRKISYWMGKGLYEALELIGIPDKKLSYFTHQAKELHEFEAQLNFIKLMTPIAEEYLSVYKNWPPEFWKNCKLMKVVLPETVRLNKIAKQLREGWNCRPKAGSDYYIALEQFKKYVSEMNK